MERARLRLARADELDRLASLIDAAYQPYRDRGLSLPDVTEGLDEEIRSERVWVLGDCVGVLNASLTPPKAHLINIAVASEAKGKGYGGVLICEAINMARDAGCFEIALGTHRDLTDVIAIYERFGFDVVEHDGMRVSMRLSLG